MTALQLYLHPWKDIKITQNRPLGEEAGHHCAWKVTAAQAAANVLEWSSLSTQSYIFFPSERFCQNFLVLINDITAQTVDPLMPGLLPMHFSIRVCHRTKSQSSHSPV
jgi:hypothetical protein